ncbi:MAG: NAD(P)/FAD-dependent oxidoreductase [Candidatus Brocadiae bacterium]|nr:NAD(P)/FAD-dependent oxidoreductase [Candidatus Brocadiia bacterium]
MDTSPRSVDVLIVGASLSAAACAKRLVDAGLETVCIERKELPRHKICSGILSPRGHRFLLENFGPIPREILHEPTSCTGVAFHFPSAPSIEIDFDGGPTPHLYRRNSDWWAIRRSGVEVQDRTSFVRLEEVEGGVLVDLNRRGRPEQIRARWVVAADGPTSMVVKAVYPGYQETIPWFMVGQKFHDIVRCPLDTRYFHFWFHPGLGHYTWSHARDGRQIVGVGFDVGHNFDAAHRNVVRYLHRRHDVELGPAQDSEGCGENFGLSLINRYVFGRGRVLVTGQAAGFLNMMAEGMSAALHSGAIAGEAVVEAAFHGRPVQEVYRKHIESEVRRCSDQWNPLQILFARPHEADFWKALRKLGWGDRARVVSEVVKFAQLYAKFRWGRQILGQAFHRLVAGRYEAARWI